MRITPEWLKTDAVQFVLGELGASGYKAYAVGGCVRDAVIGLPCKDIDIATSATPEDVERIFSDWKTGDVKLLPTGVDHGTWTVMVEGEPFEVTTFRKDVATDGRRATVAYAKTMEEDAQRRDFTMNALYMDWQGYVFDPTGQGIADIMARNIRFVGNANERCEEDYLRIMRLFRFHAQFGVGPMDSDAYWAARDNAEGLLQVSGERIWSELKKILSTHTPVEALHEMVGAGVLDVIMPDRGDVLSVAEVISAERDAALGPRWQRRFAALLHKGHEIPFPASNEERKEIADIIEHKRFGGSLARTAYKTRSRNTAVDCYVIACGKNRIPCMPYEEQVQLGLNSKCPVSADYLMSKGIKPGPELGRLLKKADDLFLASHFKATRDQIMEKMPL
ncbi:poly(A) polymerase [Roseobacter phage DSS3P8]|nr:poly(A) polymerase [Roseobacter phage DSS3P8]